jgi:hypothetical protein
VGSLRKIAREMGVGHASALAEAAVRRCHAMWDEGTQANGGLRRTSVSDAGGAEGRTAHSDEDDDKWENFLTPVVD